MGSCINIPKNNRLDDTSSRRALSLIATGDGRNLELCHILKCLVLMLIRLRCIVNARTGRETVARFAGLAFDN